MYHNDFATSHPVTTGKVVNLVKAGRCRWKIENENNNTLKTKGYHFEHNFGHGKQHLANLLATLALLAYLVHTIIDLMDDRFRTLLQKIGSRERLFDDIVTLTTFLCFKSWTALLDFMLVGLERRHQADEIQLWVAAVSALATLQRLSCADVDVPIGGLAYTQWLNERAGIESDLTIARQGETEFLVMTGVASTYRDSWHLRKHLLGDTHFEGVSAAYACLAIQDPQAHAVLAHVANCDLSNQAFAFATGCITKVAGVEVWLQRISYNGELGWELFIPAADASQVYQTLWQAGQAYDLCNVGLHAVNSLRLEKVFRHWGHDIGPADYLQQASLAFTAKPDAKDFIGRDAFLAQTAAGLPERRLVQFRLHDPEPLLYQHQPIVLDGQTVGYLTSGMYGHSLGSAIGMGYVNLPNLTAENIRTSSFEIEIACQRFAAEASLQGFMTLGVCGCGAKNLSDLGWRTCGFNQGRTLSSYPERNTGLQAEARW